MNKFLAAATCTLFLVFSTGQSFQSPYIPSNSKDHFGIQSAPNRILVKYKKQGISWIQSYFIASVEANYSLQKVKYLPLIDVYLYSTLEDKEATLQTLKTSSLVEYAEPDYLVHIDAQIPNDPQFDQLWGLQNTGQTVGLVDADIDAPEAWDLVTGSSSVIVGVLDTGIDYNHEDLHANMWTNPGEVPNNNIDDDSNGYVDDYYGINAILENGNPMDDNGHGTHCSGTIGAVGNNGVGITGVCWLVKLMALKFLGNDGYGFVSDSILCIQYAINKGAKILNNSWGGGGYSIALKDAIESAKNAGILFLAAAGNDSQDIDNIPHYPSSYDNENILSVAATDHNDALASFSNYGKVAVDVAAPGVSIRSTIPNNLYQNWNGTSMATPFVSGLAALILAQSPTLTWLNIKDKILFGVDPLASLTNKVSRGGRINAFSSCYVPSAPIIFLSPSQLNFGATTQGSVSTPQKFRISNVGANTLDWTVSTLDSWISLASTTNSGLSIQATSVSSDAAISVEVNPLGMSPGNYYGSVTIASTNATNSPQNLAVNLTVYEPGSDSFPFGAFDTPLDSSIVSGSVAITGWALDDIEVSKVEIKREPDPDDPLAAIGSDGLVYIGEAFLVKGSRADIEALYTNYPYRDRAGWGYLMLTHGLPRKGNGTFRFHAIAEDATGKRTTLGIKQITSDNINSAKPFGTIDTPAPGGVISGTQYINFGWALTPIPKWIPYDGSTLYWSIDSVIKGNVDYGDNRTDIAGAFPEHLNANTAGGHKYIDTTPYTNGVHTIGWLAYDSAGVGDGMGSRFFEIQNVGVVSAEAAALSRLGLRGDTTGQLEIRTTEDRDIKIEEMGSIKLEFKAKEGLKFVGWGEDLSKDLPIGSTIDAEIGSFYWTPAPGFLNKQILHFAVTDGKQISQPVEVVINIVPKKYRLIDLKPLEKKIN
ncbi:MAG: S8 family serine peptidase [Candidatus Aminicenantes bacterium]|nr:S8 family serine peptidase [Candidatus Aminicenantes bacterium]